MSSLRIVLHHSRWKEGGDEQLGGEETQISVNVSLATLLVS
jgi:hypothetical protein